MFVQLIPFPATGGGAGVPFTGFRSSSITSLGTGSTAVTLPSGATAGDQLWLFRAGTTSLTATTGFTTHGDYPGTFFRGIVEYKVLTSGDISTGTVTVTDGGTQGCVWAVCLKGQPSTIVTTDATDFHRDGGGGGTTRSVTTVESAAVGDFAMIFAAQRDSSATAPTPSIGSVDQTLTGIPAASGYLIASVASSGTLSCTWTYHTGISNGSFNGIVVVRA